MFAVAIALAGCADHPYGEDIENVCDDAADALVSCGRALEQSPFGTCQPAQEAQARELLELYRADGCAAISDAKADSVTCSVLPFLCVQHSVAELAPFTTDGCSMFPDGTPSDGTRWQDCCVIHDYAYYMGGSEQMRDAADNALHTCIRGKSNQTLADLVYLGVRIGGTPVLPTPWRWGYGWKYDPVDGYRELPDDQARAAAQQVLAHRISPVPPTSYSDRMNELAAITPTVPQLPHLIEQVNALVRAL